MVQKSFFIKTFGCQMNERDTEIMAQTLSTHGYIESMDMDQADLVILNTCSIRAKAEQKVMSLLGYMRKLKQQKPDLHICVAGCVAQQEGQRIIDRMPHVDLVIGTQNIYNIIELLARADQGGTRVVTGLSEKYQIPALLPDAGGNVSSQLISPQKTEFAKFVTIMQGCNNYCTYCVVPYTRGREISRQKEDIIDEVKAVVARGVKEITLLGQNVNSYGRTNSVTTNALAYGFADLLHDVADIPGVRRLRFTTSNPKDLTDQLINCFRDIDNLCPQFHLPVQAGADAVLKKMNRKYSVAQYLELVDKLRTACPEIALTTDIIVGFPGETDRDFEGTMDLLETVRYHGSFSFKYSDRPGTRASSFTDKVAEEVKTARLARFQKRQDEISLERNQEYIGSKRELLIEEVSELSLRGRTTTNHIVHLADPVAHNLEPGDFVWAEIVSAGQHSLKGRLAD